METLENPRNLQLTETEASDTGMKTHHGTINVIVTELSKRHCNELKPSNHQLIVTEVNDTGMACEDLRAYLGSKRDAAAILLVLTRSEK